MNHRATFRKIKLCGMYKVYSLLNIESIVLKSKIEHYKVSLTIQEDKEKENPIDKKTIEEAENIVNYFVNCCVVFFFLRKGCRVAVIVVLLSILLTRLLYFSHAFDIMLWICFCPQLNS